jgi:hypothetical protein
VSFRKRDDGDYSVTANIDVEPSSFGGHWFDIGARVPAEFSALRASGDAYNNHGEFRGRHSVVITRDYGVWHIDGDAGDLWDIADEIVKSVEETRRDSATGPQESSSGCSQASRFWCSARLLRWTGLRKPSLSVLRRSASADSSAATSRDRAIFLG